MKSLLIHIPWREVVKCIEYTLSLKLLLCSTPSSIKQGLFSKSAFPAVPRLTHTSGISDSRYGVLKFKPGQRKSYSHEGYNLLGTIIEGRTKQSYGQYLKKNIDSRRAGAKSVGTDAVAEGAGCWGWAAGDLASGQHNV